MLYDMRGHARVPTSLEVSWLERSEVHRSHIRDISLGGCYISTVDRVKAGDVVYVNVQTHGGRGLLLEGEVVHQQWPMGFGLRFFNLGEEERLEITRLIDGGGGAAA